MLLWLLSLHINALNKDLWAFTHTYLLAVAIITRNLIMSIFDWSGWTCWHFANSEILRHSAIHDRLSQIRNRRILLIVNNCRLDKIILAPYIINLCWINHGACLTLIAITEPASLHKVLFIFFLTICQIIVAFKFISYKIILLNCISFIKNLNWLFIWCILMTWGQFWWYINILGMLNTPYYRWSNVI